MCESGFVNIAYYYMLKSALCHQVLKGAVLLKPSKLLWGRCSTARAEVLSRPSFTSFQGNGPPQGLCTMSGLTAPDLW